MIRKLLIFQTFFSLFFPMLYAQGIESGKVYMFQNVGHPENSMALSGASNYAVGSATNSSDTKQLWYLVADDAQTGFYFRNASNGGYLSSPKATSSQWSVKCQSTPDDATMLMVIETHDGSTVIRPKSHTGYAYAHNDAGNKVVCWTTNGSTGSHWNYTEIPMSEEEKNKMLERFRNTGDEMAKQSTYQTYLDNLFTDKSCTELRDPSASSFESNPNYTSLPATLQKMVDKVKEGNWAESYGSGEYDQWDSKHAEKYRVQLYEPYSEGSAASGMAGIQAYTNMNNPTGIIANAGEMLYVMVGGDIQEGATLYIGGVPDCNMYNGVTSGTELKKGLNMILCNADLTHYFIYYTVNTVSNKAPVKGRELSNYNDLKIHIEGGKLNGFFDYRGDSLYEKDLKEDFLYTTKRAKHPMYDLVGKYVILHFFLEDTGNLPGETPQICVKNAFDASKNPSLRHDDPVITMKAWDDMCFAERILMGIQSDSDIQNSYNQGLYSSIVKKPFGKGEYATNLDFQYSDYFNNKMMGITLQASGLYMNATAWRTAYAPGTVSAILSQFPEAGIWGPAHEYGHMNQTPMRIAGTTEESNNVFSNVANFFVCQTTSRCDYPSEQLKNFNEGKTYLDNGTWGTTRMFWQLWCYYHATRHNTSFYPRLYELLRKHPLERRKDANGKLLPKYDLLHFAKMCCIAAEEDLTNFFLSWGFFAPQDNYHIDDYDIYDCVLTTEDIQEIKDAIKALDLPKNDAIILIDDRVNNPWNDGFGYDKSKCGNYGGLSDFEKGNEKGASGSFEFTVDGNNVTVSGSGSPGVGFLIYDEDGNLIGFSNSDNFTLSSDAAQALVDGTASVKAIGADNKEIEVVDPVREGSPQRKTELLQNLIASCDNLLAQIDESLTHVGKLIPEACTALIEERNRVEESIENNAADSDALTQDYLTLSKLYYDLLNNPEARVKCEAGASYRLINHNYTAYALDANPDNLLAAEYSVSSDAVPFTQQWVMEAVTEGDNVNVYLKNLGQGKYASTTKKQSALVPMSTTPQTYSIVTIEPGVYAFAPDNELRYGLHIDASKKVVQWNTSSVPTQWEMIKVMSAKQIQLRDSLAQKMKDAENLLATAGIMERVSPKDYIFADANIYSNAPYTGNNSDGFKHWSVISDKNTATFFHSDYSGNDSKDGLDHYIRFEAPDNGNFRFVNLSYTTRPIDNIGTNPKTIVIEASADMNKWRDVFHANNLKTGNAVTNETGEFIVPADTRYIRFMVTEAGNSGYHGHPYFVVSEMSISDLGEPLFTPDRGFPYLRSEDMQTLYDDLTDAKLAFAYSGTSAEDFIEKLTQMEGASSTITSLMIPKVDVKGVSFAVDPIVTKVGEESLAITAVVDPEDATFPQFEWTILDETLAQVVATEGKTALLKPLKNGVTEINVNVVDNPWVNATATLKILPEVPVESVVVIPAEISVPLNAGVFTLNTLVYPENASIQNLIWSSSDQTVILVDENTGEITPQRQGSAELIAVSTDGSEISGKCVVTITNPIVEGVVLYPSELVMEPGDQMQITATYLPEDAQQPLMTWKSNNEDVAVVDPSGVVSALAKGTAVISVTASVNGKEITAEAYVTVNPLSLKSLALDPIAMTLEKGETATVLAKMTPEAVETELAWNVADSNIVSLTISADKRSASIKAVGSGMTTITVTPISNPDLSASCQVTVPEISVTDIELYMEDTMMDVNDGARTVKAIIYPADAPTPWLKWESSDETVLKVASTSPLEAEITPLKSGEVTLTVSHGDKPEISDSKQVVVTKSSAIESLFDDKETAINVYDTKGQILFKDVRLEKLKNLAPGIYLIQQGKTTKEIVIKQ